MGLSTLTKSEFVADIDSLVRRLGGNLSKPAILRNIPDNVRSSKGSKNLRSAFLELLQNYKAKGNYGHLSTGLVMGLVLEGNELFHEVEAKGLLLCGETVEKKFYGMLHRLKSCLSEFGDVGPSVGDRIETYINYCDLTAMTERRIERLRQSLRDRSMVLVKGLLGLCELYFLKEHFRLETPKDHRISHLLEVARTPEDFASVASLLLWKANNISPLNRWECEGPIHDELTSPSFAEVVEDGCILSRLNDVAKVISCFGYRLVRLRGDSGVEVFKVTPPTPEFEYCFRLGNVRDQFNRQVQYVHAANKFQSPLLGMDVATRHTIEELEDLLTEWVLKPYPRVKLKIPCAPDLFEPLLKHVYFDDVQYVERIRDDYLTEPNSQTLLTDGLTLSDFMKIGKALRFISVLNANAICHYSSKYNKMSFNSLVRVAIEEQHVKELAVPLGLKEDLLGKFIRLLGWDAKEGSYCDLQYQPFVRIHNKLVYLPALFATSNFFRNVQVSHKIRNAEQGSTFLMLCRNALEERFEKIVSEKRIKGNGRKTEIDIVVWHGKTLYLFECKYSLPPCDYQETRDIWRDILKGASQMRIAKEILNNPLTRQSYLAGWFPGASVRESADMNIRTCVLCSHRLFAGISIEGVPVRDFYSFSSVMTEHVMSFGMAEPDQEGTRVRYSIAQDGKFSQADLDDYLEDSSRYFRMFAANMRPYTEFDTLIPGKLTLAWEKFLYFMDTTMVDFISFMDSLGFYRLPDERVLVNFPLTKEALEKQMAEHKGGQSEG